MIELRNKRVLVVGLARSGRAVAHRLAREGARITVTDARPPSVFLSAVLKELMAQKAGLELGIHRDETFRAQDLIVVSPGVPWDLPQLDLARRSGVRVIPEIEAASWFFNGTLVGITGTNGKTTTTTLLARMLDASGYSAFAAGNIGVPLISTVDLFAPESIVVTELSSFQLEAIQDFHPYVAVLLNITENHLDRHRTFSAYVSAKAQLFRNQKPDDYAILNADDPTVMSLAPALVSRKIFFSLEQDLPEGVLLSRGRILYRVAHLERVLIEEREIRLRGQFNVQNVMAAAAAACVLGADFKAIRSAVHDFHGVEHRLERVASVRGVEFYNDSKATSVDATAKALATFERGVHLILGGKDKGAPYSPLRPLIDGRVKSVYLIGSAAEKIAADLEGADIHHAGDLTMAVQMAFARAVSGDVVLLSPACASFDQFEDFEERGRAFKQVVQRLPDMRLASMYPSPVRAEKIAPALTPDTETMPVATGEPKAHAWDESRYVYETGTEDIPANLSKTDEEPAAGVPERGSLGPIESSLESVSPYEVIEAQSATEAVEEAPRDEEGVPPPPQRPASGEQRQIDLFSPAAPGKRAGKLL
ncbi:MAG: UDP-N-acetylmuramoyl-L-alanine--D-glutamate ligase [Candidatus Acidiferrales bacterium]